ncbi:MAG: SGNH/GDSL hydrolase family protein [Vicinamibacterales bacterium]
MRIHVALYALALFLVGSACKGAGDASPTSPTTPSGPPAAGSTIVYTVVGASDAIGYGSTKVCAPFEDCDGTGYPWVAARQLRSQGFTIDMTPLGIPSAVISPSFLTLASQWGIGGIVGTLSESEAPFVRRDSTIVTVFTGGNDVNVITGALANDAGSANPNAFIDQQVALFATEFSALLSTIRGRAPGARIVVLNLPNMSKVPYRVNSQALLKSWAHRASVGITAAINSTPNVRVVDLMCDPRFYVASTFSADGFHPSDAGYAIMGAEIVKAITQASYPAPQSSCAQMN